MGAEIRLDQGLSFGIVRWAVSFSGGGILGPGVRDEQHPWPPKHTMPGAPSVPTTQVSLDGRGSPGGRIARQEVLV